MRLRVDLSHYRERAKESISVLVDPALQEIPSDPLLVQYQGTAQVRLYSEDTLNHLDNMVTAARQVMRDVRSDTSGVRVVLEQDSLPPPEAYNELLRQMVAEGLNNETILGYCSKLHQLSERLAQCSNGFEKIVIIAVCLAQFGSNGPFVASYLDSPPSEKSILLHFVELLFMQEAMFAENRNKASDKSEPKNLLAENQVVCSFSNLVINVERTRLTKKRATDFLALVVMLALLAKIEDDSLANFIREQPPGYLKEAEQTLRQYVANPPSFKLTAVERQFIDGMGMGKLAWSITTHKKQAPNYLYLWDQNKSAKDNILRVLSDYSKTDWHCPTLGLFFTGHWNRHHHGIVKQAINNLKQDDSLEKIMLDLETTARTRKGFNEKGSLARRLQFIKSHFDWELGDVASFLSAPAA